MKHDKQKNYAFIDEQNLYRGVQKLGWKLNRKKLRIYLKDKYAIEKAFIFLGYIPQNKHIYQFL